MTKELLSPCCKSNRFNKISDERIKIIDDGEILSDECIDGFAEEVTYMCSDCGKEISEDELVRK